MPARSAFLVVPLALAFPLTASAQATSGCPGEVDAAIAAVSHAVASANAVLATAPTPANFTSAWTDGFAAAVRAGSGIDGRLSRNEAERLAADSLYGDNAVNWLEKKGQESVSVEKLIGEAAKYAFANGKRVAGADGRISLADAAGLPADLQDDYFALRGRLETPSAGSPRAAIEAAAKDLIYSSEGDARFVFVESDAAFSGPITAESIRAALGAQHDTLTTDGSVWFSPEPEYMKIADRHPEVRDAEVFFERLTEVWDPNDPEGAAQAAKYQALVDALKANLTDIAMIRFNQNGDPESDAITSSVFVVGRTAEGKLAGVLTGAVET